MSRTEDVESVEESRIGGISCSSFGEPAESIRGTFFSLAMLGRNLVGRVLSTGRWRWRWRWRERERDRDIDRDRSMSFQAGGGSIDISR